MKFKTGNIIEINQSEQDKLEGRIKIKLIAHEIYPDEEEISNRNGIKWKRCYVEKSLSTCINMPLVVSYIDKDTGLISGHGEYVYDDEASEGEKIFFENSEVVGTVYNAYIDDIEFDDGIKTVLVLEGYIYSQRNVGLVHFLREKINKEKETICGSIEINNTSNNTEIVYENGKYLPDGSLNMLRIPMEYIYSGHAILYTELEADPSAHVLEMNSLNNKKEGEEKLSKVIAKSKVVEVNKITVYELYDKIIDEINLMLNKNYKYDTWVYELYVDTCEVIIKDDSVKDTFYSTTYSFSEGKVEIGDIIEVEKGWIPKSKSTPVEINKCKKENNACGENKKEKNENNDDEKKEEDSTMKVEELNTKIGELNTKIGELQNELITKDTKISEVNELLVKSQTQVTELSTKLENAQTELNSVKEEKEKLENEKLEAQTKAEINEYIENTVKPLKLDNDEMKTISELNSLQEIKNKVSEICVARVVAQSKSQNSVSNVETNSIANTRIHEKDVVATDVPECW